MAAAGSGPAPATVFAAMQYRRGGVAGPRLTRRLVDPWRRLILPGNQSLQLQILPGNRSLQLGILPGN